MEHLYQYLNKLNPITEETLKKLFPLFQERTLRKNDYFIKDGEYAREIGFLTHGVLRGFYRDSEGVEYNKHFFTPPSFIGGYASLITEAPGQINQQALSDAIILVADFSALISLYDSCPDLERAARKLAEHFFVQKEQREIEIVRLDADKRYLIFQQEYPDLENLIPQYHIASYLGITPTQLSRVRRKFSGR
jgi:CRP-like cAMP-binding protein